MDIRITLPEYGRENKSIKDLAVSILIYKHPLTLKELYHEIKRQYRHPGSYQAVHKAVKELVRDNVLIKNRSNIEISTGWITLLSKFHEILRENYPDSINAGSVIIDEKDAKAEETIEELIEKKHLEENAEEEEEDKEPGAGKRIDDEDEGDDDDTEPEEEKEPYLADISNEAAIYGKDDAKAAAQEGQEARQESTASDEEIEAKKEDAMPESNQGEQAK